MTTDLLNKLRYDMHRKSMKNHAEQLRRAASGPLLSDDTPEAVALRDSYLAEADSIDEEAGTDK
jgi:hypothetical protein